MFGEHESESPRVPSPWDPLMSRNPSPPSSPLRIENIVPKLAPEAEEGNVEYKLQLLSPSPARFTRLVTQMKWRLLEGGGQAYYELGVADSGALVGLPRSELEQSLETLEMMAGEIGASVIVVKEIEVPAAMAGLAASETDRWNGKRYKGKLLTDTPDSGGGSSTPASTTDEDRQSTTDVTDADDDEDYPGLFLQFPGKGHRSDSCGDLFAMDSELDGGESGIDLSLQPFSPINLEISAVYKPRPSRKRVHHVHTASPAASSTKKLTHGTKSKRNPRDSHLSHLSTSVSTILPDHVGKDGESGYAQTKGQAKTINRRQARDRRRELKKTLESAATAAVANLTGTNSEVKSDTPMADLASALQSLHVTVEVEAVGESIDSDPPADDTDIIASNGSSNFHSFEARDNVAYSSDVRLIVEALVVRKMSLEEGFLDFGGFALI